MNYVALSFVFTRILHSTLTRNNLIYSKPLSSDTLSGIRINKCFPNLSRRAADNAIVSGQVTVNNIPAKIGQIIKLTDIVCFNGKIQNWNSSTESKIWIKFWKPFGYTCTANLKDKSSIFLMSQLKNLNTRLYSVGRLDKDSTGLLLLTNDGVLTQQLLDPKTNHRKIYEVTLDSIPTDDHIFKLSDGVNFEYSTKRETWSECKTFEIQSKRCSVKRIDRICPNSDRMIEITLCEGKNRQIRKMTENIGLKVTFLHRIEFAGITLDELCAPGEWKHLTPKEIDLLNSSDSKIKCK